MFKPIRKRERDVLETSVEDLVCANHHYRKLLHTVDFKKLCKTLEAIFLKIGGAKTPC